MTRILLLALRQTWTDWRAGELRLIALAIVLAVAAITAVGVFADRLQGGLTRDAAQLLGGDVVVRSDQPLPPAWAERALAAGLSVAHTASFPSMARAPQPLGGESRLAAIKAVSPSYPLRGALSIERLSADAAGVARIAEEARRGPACGTVWVDEALADALNLGLEQMLLLGDASFRIAAFISLEPDRGAGFSSFSPRVMLCEADLPATGLVQPASRINYRMALAAPPGRERALAAERRLLEGEVESKRVRGVQVESLESGRPEMSQSLDRAERFLNLVALLAVLLAAVAVAIAAWDFARRRLDDAALLRVLGLKHREMAAIFTLELLFIATAAALLGAALGWGLHLALLGLMARLVPGQPGPATLWPALVGVSTALTLALGFGLPALLQLARVPPLRVIRRDLGGIRMGSAAMGVLGLLALGSLIWFTARDAKLGSLAVVGVVLVLLAFTLLAYGLIRAVRRWLSGHASAPLPLRMALHQWAAEPWSAALNMAALAVGLFALALLVLLRTDLVASWRAATPPDAPNRFVINIQPDQADAFQALLREAKVAGGDFYPMMRGRLIAINGKAVTERSFAEERAARLVEREFNLSHSAEKPAHNAIEKGRWAAGEAGAISVEVGLAETLGLKLGDSLTFDVAGMHNTARITSLRTVDWGSMRANFFVMYPLADMPDWPATFLAAFRAPSPNAGFDKRLARQFPNLTVVDVTASIAQVQAVLDQVIRAVELLFVLALAVGLTVLAASLVASRQARLREAALARALGAPRALLAKAQRLELLITGALAGLMAVVAALLAEWVLVEQVFEFAWAPPVWAVPAGVVAGAFLAWAAGWWTLRRVLDQPVLATLRESA